MLKGVSIRIKIGIAIAVCLVVMRFVLFPFYDWQQATVEKVNILGRSVEKKKALIGNEKKIDALLQEAQSSFKKAMKFYYTDFSDPQALQLVLQKKIEAVSTACGVKIKSTNWLYPSGGYIVQAPIKIRCEAPPLQIIHFIKAIEGNDRFFSINRVNIIGNGTRGSLNAEFEISAFGVAKQKLKPQ